MTAEDHMKPHNELKWNDEWRQFLSDSRNRTAVRIRAQLRKMMTTPKYWNLLKHGAKARQRWQEWGGITNKVKEAGEAFRECATERKAFADAIATARKTGRRVSVGIVRGGQVVGIVTFFWTASTVSVEAAEMELGRDIMFPAIETAEMLTADAGAFAGALMEAGRISKRSQQDLVNDMSEGKNVMTGPLSARKYYNLAGDSRARLSPGW